MGTDLWYAGGKSPFYSGDSVVVSLPKAELRRQGIDPDELASEDVTLDARGEGDQFVVTLPSQD